MIRPIGTTLLFGALALGLAAQDPEKPAAEKKAEPKRENPELETIKAPPQAEAEDPQKVIERLKKNFNSTEERLDEKDPGEATRKLQEKIIEDLDKLLQQSQNSGGGGGGGGSSSSSSSSSGGGGSSSGSSGKSSGNASNSGGGANSKDKKNGAGGDGQKDQAKNDPKDGKGGGGGKNKDAKNGQGGGDGIKNDTDTKKPPTVADLYKDPWGYLPAKKRQEMDAYGRQHFMRKYEQLLGEYYRTIAEQDKRREQD